jgi:hypothetical protein
MQDLYLRLGQGTPLTYAQEDLNFKRIKAAIDSLETAVAGAGTGTVTSVGLTLPNIFTVSGSPVISSGSLTATLASQSANRIFSSPNGSSGQPTFRALVAADLPTVTIAKGGTGLTSVITNNYILASNGTGYEGRLVTVGTGLTLTTGTGSMLFELNLAAINLTSLSGVLGNTNGGTNQNSYTTGDTLYASATNTLSKLAIGTSGQVLTVSAGGVPTWAAPTASGVTSIEGTTGAINLSSSEITFTVPTAGEVNLAIATATGSVKGLLSSTDWTTFNGKATLSSGTTNYLTKVTGANTIGNSRVFDNGTNMGFGTASPSYSYHFYSAAAALTNLTEGTSGTKAGVKFNSVIGALQAFTSNVAVTSTNLLNFCPNGLDLSLGQYAARFEANNVFSIKYGLAIDNIAYYNAAGGSSVTIANDSYGVILAIPTAASVTVTLPSSPVDGQEVCIMVEEDKTLSIATGTTKVIFGKTASPATSISLTIDISSNASSILFKYYSAGNGGLGAWYLTGY